VRRTGPRVNAAHDCAFVGKQWPRKSIARGDPGRSEAFAAQHDRIVEIQQRRIAGQLDLGQRERKPAAAAARGSGAGPGTTLNCSATHETDRSAR
jgi:hypothetical protein